MCIFVKRESSLWSTLEGASGGDWNVHNRARELSLSGAHLKVQNDGPYKAQDNGRLALNNIRWVDVHKFDLQR